MSVHSISFDLSSIPPLWRQRLLLLLVVACFVLPLAAAWLLIGPWRPESSAQHGELLNPCLLYTSRIARMQVHPGQFYQTHFWARNLADQPMTGQAIPSVAPGLAASHFQKIECFCFNRQLFRAGEGKEMPVTFRIDPQLPADVRTVTLSYTCLLYTSRCV